MKISDIRTVLPLAHNVCIETDNANYDEKKTLYLGKASDIPDNLNSINITDIEANDFMELTVYVNEKDVS